jgi:chromosome partitioning protein
MNVIVVANPKGGVGKSTVSTNLAGYLARRSPRVMLGDVDRQQSARAWLDIRSPQLPAIQSWETRDGEPARPPKHTTDVVLDTPAGLHGKLLDKVLGIATHVVVPLQASLFDIYATANFLAALREAKAVRKNSVRIGVVATRVDPRTRSAQELERFLSGYELPVLAHLRDTQLYVQLAARGMTLFDLNPQHVARDLAQWAPLTDWLAPVPRSAAIG